MRRLEIVAVFMIAISILGVFGNTQLIYATFKVKQLHHRNGFLVGIIATLNFVNILFEMANAIEIFIGKSLMERRTCNMTVFMYGFSSNMADIAYLFLAIDRLLAVSSPTRYRTIRSSHFIAATFVVGLIYYIPFLIFGFILADNTLVEPCNPPSALAPPLVEIWTYLNGTVAITVILLSIVNYFIMRSSRKHIAQGDAVNYRRQMHVTKSLLIIMIVYALTTVLSSLILFAIELLKFSKEMIAEVTSYVCLPFLLNSASQYYILFWRSKNYRGIFLKQLGLGQISSFSTNTIVVREVKKQKPRQQHHTIRRLTHV